MELIFIGTSSGRTSLNRFHSSLLFHDSKNSILVDTGDGISKALLTQNISVNSISHIILSHYHSDHLAGLPSLLTQMIIEDRTTPIKIYTHQDLKKTLNSFLQFSFIFTNKLKFDVEIIGYDFSSKMNITQSFNFSAKQNSHIKNKYEIENAEINFISSSFLFSVNNNKVVYTSDIAEYDDLFLFNEVEPNIFITEATHIPLNKIEDAITILNPKQTYLTHIDNEEEISDWYDQLSLHQKDRIKIAVDEMRMQI